ncbi:MAG TPA: PQQ-binding-like beta-propeller repeat protein [Pyrinomonadaceae bacterium]|nr:PQQ-binding-like beta-propeller repeat protein [Pyrinomonadaceae bacterium]
MIKQLSPPRRPPRVSSRTLLKAAIAVLLVPAALTLPAVAQRRAAPPARQPGGGSPPQEIETTFRWEAKGSVRRYRLQVSRDASFDDIVFDGAVEALESTMPLAPGTYFWRVAPAPQATGKYDAPQVILVTRTPQQVTPPAAAAVPTILRPAANVGWETATGNVDRPVPARLRPGQTVDLVAVNSEGTIYALEGATGTALWTARYSPPGPGGAAAANSSSRTPGAPALIFTPVVVAATQGDTSNVLVAFDGGVRLLEGGTGRELWRTSLNGRPTGGCVAQLGEEAGAIEIAVATEAPSGLTILNAATGVIASRANLDGEVIGLPIPFQSGAERGVALSLKGAQIDIRRGSGERLRAVKFDVPFVTPPLVIATPRATLVVVGTEHGLLFLGGDLKPLGRITTEGESPRGRLAAADIEGDGTIEIVMLTSRGRIAVISAEGKIDWSAQGGRDAFTPSFADLNRDGYLDVIAADDSVFARGFSGRDGSIIWQVADEPKGSEAAAGGDARPLRTLALAPNGAGAPLIVGGDRARRTLRAVGLPAGSVRVASK